MNPDQPLSPGTLLENRYRVRGVLGQGGMSRVYLADAIHLTMLVAVKENLQNSAEARAQFEREAQLLARLTHPNIPRVIDRFTNTATGRQYLVMEYVEGEDLATMIRRGGPLPEPTALAWIRQILDAVEYLHHQQPPVIHRDIKPANIKITPQGKAVLVDFGISKFYDASRGTVTGMPAVTAGYAPPEQYGFRTTQRSDIYALGATLYTMLTGRIPPDAPLRQAGEEVLVPPHQLVPVSPSVENALLRAVQVENTNRWQSISEMRAALEGRLPPKSTEADAAKTRLVSTLPNVDQRQMSQPDHSAPKKSTPVPWWIAALLGFTVGVSILLLLIVAIVKGTPVVALVPVQTPTSASVTVTELPTSKLTATPPASATVTAVPTSESSATPVADAVVVTNIDLHTGPGYSTDVQGTLGPGDQIKALACATVSVFGINSEWVLIRTINGRQGWISANQVNWNISLSAIPATVIPTATRAVVSVTATATTTRVNTAVPTPAATPTVPGPHLASCNDTPPGMAGLLWINQFDNDATVTIVDHEYHVPGNSRMLIPIPADKKFVIDAFIPGAGRLRPAPGPFTWSVGYCEVWNPGRSSN